MPDPLYALYQQWLEYAMFENRVIKEGKWADLNTYTQLKQELMESIRKLEAANPSLSEKISSDLRLLIHQLLDLEELNHSLVQERMKEMRLKQDDIHRRSHVLNQIRKHYQTLSPEENRFSRKA